MDINKHDDQTCISRLYDRQTCMMQDCTFPNKMFDLTLASGMMHLELSLRRPCRDPMHLHSVIASGQQKKYVTYKKNTSRLGEPWHGEISEPHGESTCEMCNERNVEQL